MVDDRVARYRRAGAAVVPGRGRARDRRPRRGRGDRAVASGVPERPLGPARELAHHAEVPRGDRSRSRSVGGGDRRRHRLDPLAASRCTCAASERSRRWSGHACSGPGWTTPRRSRRARDGALRRDSLRRFRKEMPAVPPPSHRRAVGASGRSAAARRPCSRDRSDREVVRSRRRSSDATTGSALRSDVGETAVSRLDRGRRRGCIASTGSDRRSGSWPWTQVGSGSTDWVRSELGARARSARCLVARRSSSTTADTDPPRPDAAVRARVLVFEHLFE